MKTLQKIYKNTLLIILIGISLSSCESTLDDLRDNPNAVTEIDDAALFTKAVRSLFLQTTSQATARFAGQHAHYYVAGSTSRQPDQYTDGFDGLYNSMYKDMYGGVIRHIEDVLQITSTEETKNEVRNAMANIVAVMGYAVITDAYGDVPYTEGGKGKTEGIILPKYDTQEFIYKDLMDRLTASMAVLKTADPTMGYPKSDPVFQNDLSKWVRLANSVKLRLAMRLRFADNALSQQIVAQCMADPLMEDPSHDAWMIQTEGTGNAWFTMRTGYPSIKVSEKMVDQLTNTNDPRISEFVSPDENGNYVGMTNGLNDVAFGNSNFAAKSDMGLAISSPQSKLYIMTATEVWFLKAEAALMYENDAAKANDLYRMGIENSFKQWKIDDSDIATFMASPTATLMGSNEEMQSQIGTQMWIGLTPNYFEGWSNIRRTGFPEIPERTADNLERGVTNGIMPKRFKYSSFELSSNNENVTEAIERQGANKIDTPVWWDKN